RRQHIQTGDLPSTKEPTLSRGALLDQRLGVLIASVSTALDEYRRLASEEGAVDFKAEAGIVPQKGSVGDAVEDSRKLDEALAQAEDTIETVSRPTSEPADNLQRQLRDARGLNRMASAEIRMPTVVVSWLRKTADTLKDYPTIIDRSVGAMQVSVDVVEKF